MRLTKVEEAGMRVQLEALAKAATNGYVAILTKEGGQLARSPLSSVKLSGDTITGKPTGVEADGRGKAHHFTVFSKADEPLWSGTVGVGDTRPGAPPSYNMMVRTTEFVPGVYVTFEEFSYTMSPESDE